MEVLHRLCTLLVLVATTIYYCQAKSLGASETSDAVWQPENRTKSEWMACKGMPKDVCDRANSKYKQLQDLLNHDHGTGDKSSPPAVNGLSPDAAPVPFANNGQGPCMWWTEEQLDMMLEEAQYRKDLASGKRKKRTLVDLKKYPSLKWSLPIYYKFDGTQPDSDKKTIRNAFQHWMDNTCIRFNELPTGAPYSNNHIILTSQAAGCYSYVGKTNYIPQPINLYSNCLFRFGTPVHEIGHTLGLYHEQMRRDRDSSIDIIWQNIYDSYYSQFSLVDGTDGLGLPYNYGSVMHYSSKEGISKNGSDTIIAKEPLYQMNMGQRTGLSFHDAKLMNMAYCQGTCTTQLSQPCQRGGYQNPNDCSRCTCPDGFSGTYCETIAPPKYENCGGVLNINPNSQEIITSPGYNTDRRFYFSKQECTWWIKAPQNNKLQLTFDGDFGLYCEFGACYHWVEVKYKKDLGEEGGRFCCYDRPQVAVVSESNEMMVIFKSNYSVDYFAAQRGFRAIVKAIPITSGDSGDDSKNPTSSSTTTSTTTATTTTTTTTTTATTTTTTPGSSRVPQIRTTPAPASACDRQDLAFLLDSSDALGSENWPKVLSFVNSVSSNILKAGGSRAAVTTFASSATNVISFSENLDASTLRSSVTTIPFKPSGLLDVVNGLDAVRSQVYATKRPGVVNNCVVVVGGPFTSNNHDQIVNAAQQMRDNGIRVTVVVVGSLVNGSEAAAIAGLGDSGVIYSDNFDSLSLSVDDTTKKICKATAQIGAQDTLWQCSFDTSSSGDYLCGMKQDTTDDFDWTVFHDPTPSDPTGPDSPFDGYNYIFIEASSPRQPNDEARLFVPNLNFNGDVCVDFYYHMYGFHINTLKLVKIINNQSVAVWMRSKEIGNVWLHATVTVNLSSGSQLQFIGIRGGEFSGDIGLDKILVRSGVCPN